MPYYGQIGFGFKMAAKKKRKSSSSSKRKKSSSKRKSGKKKLKFGSPAYRRKYLGHA